MPVLLMMNLLLNDSLWHQLLDRADERFVQEAFARFKIDAPTEPLRALRRRRQR
jgi:hypothetical protein